MASKFNELLDEENLDFLEFEDRLELSMARSLLYENEGMIQQSFMEL